MFKKILLLFIMAIALSTSYVHAESYTFNDSSITVVPEYYGGNHGGTPNDVTRNSINVSKTTGKISDLNVTISTLYTQALYDMTFVLVGPNKTGVILSSFAGGDEFNTFTRPLTLTFDDEADNQIRTSTSWYDVYTNPTYSGSYQTSAYSLGNWYTSGGGVYASTDPIGEGYFGDTTFTEDNLLSAFDDISANGVWSLLAYDNLGGDRTAFTGWSLSFSTSVDSPSAVPEPAEWVLILLTICGLGLITRFHNKITARI